MLFLCDFPDKRKSMQFKWVPTTFAFKKYTCCNLKTTELLDYALTGVCAVIRSNMVFSLLWPSVFLVIFRRFAPNSSFVLNDYHTCHKLWTEICEVCPIFKGDLIKICESLTKITLKLYQNSQKPLFKWTKLGLGGSVGCAVRLETRRSRVQPPPRSATFLRGDWSWNIFYGHSLPSADSRRAVVSFWRKNVHNTG